MAFFKFLSPLIFKVAKFKRALHITFSMKRLFLDMKCLVTFVFITFFSPQVARLAAKYNVRVEKIKEGRYIVEGKINIFVRVKLMLHGPTYDAHLWHNILPKKRNFEFAVFDTLMKTLQHV